MNLERIVGYAMYSVDGYLHGIFCWPKHAIKTSTFQAKALHLVVIFFYARIFKKSTHFQNASQVWICIFY